LKKLVYYLLLCLTINTTAQDSKQIKEIVISGAKKEIEKQEVSQTIDVIDKKTIQIQSPSSSGELLQNTGKITVQQSQNGGGSPIIRGFEANRVLVVVDGVRMNTTIFRSGHLQNVMRVDPSQLENLEVYYGAGSTLYGSDAIGGVMFFQTAKPRLIHETSKTITGNAFTRFASAPNEKAAGFSLNISGKIIASLTSFSYSDFGNLMMGNNRTNDQPWFWGKRIYYQEYANGKDIMVKNPNPNEQIQSAYSQYNILQKFLYKPNERASHILNFQYSNSSDVPRYDALTERGTNVYQGYLLPENPTTNPFNNSEWYYGPESRLMLAYSYDQKLKMKYLDELNLTIAYQNYKESRNSRGFGANNLGTNGASRFRSQIENVDVGSINLDFHKTTKAHQLTFGIEGIMNWVNSSAKRYNIITGEQFYAATRYPDGGTHTGNYSIYAQDVYAITKELAYLNIGARYQYYTIDAVVKDSLRNSGSFGISNSAYSGNIGLSFLPHKNHRLALNFSTAFRIPNLDDMNKVFINTGNIIQVNNPNVKPERAFNYEINGQHQILNDIKLEWGAYYTHMQDYISNIRTQINGMNFLVDNGINKYYFTLGNESLAHVHGLYSSLNIKLNKLLKLSADINYTYGRINRKDSVQNMPLSHIPPLSGRFELSHITNKFQTDFYIFFNTAKERKDYDVITTDDNREHSADPINGYTPAWYTMNLRTRYRINPKWNIQLAIENLLDLHYRVFSSGISASGRNLRLTLRTNF
jgi:hemoglobin/transferrin/lactoferrin receptor protein